MTRFSIFFQAVAVSVISASGAWADGQVAFRDHCATCHGVDAMGDGPMAPVLGVAPPDLTVLSAQNDGVFPVGLVLRRVDGREEVLAHGGPMPVFGTLLEGPSRAVLAQDGTEIVTSERLAEIAEWLEEVQQ